MTFCGSTTFIVSLGGGDQEEKEKVGLRAQAREARLMSETQVE